MRNTFGEFWSWTCGLHNVFSLIEGGALGQKTVSKESPAACWLGYKKCFLRNNVRTAIKHPASAETTLISNTWFHVAINTQVFIRQSSELCSESLVSVEVSQEPGRKQRGLRDTKLWLIVKKWNKGNIKMLPSKTTLMLWIWKPVDKLPKKADANCVAPL